MALLRISERFQLVFVVFVFKPRVQGGNLYSSMLLDLNVPCKVTCSAMERRTIVFVTSTQHVHYNVFQYICCLIASAEEF